MEVPGSTHDDQPELDWDLWDDPEQGLDSEPEQYIDPEKQKFTVPEPSEDEIRQATSVTSEQIIELAKRVERGDLGAREQLVAANAGLVYLWAKRFQGQGLDIEDLVQEGQIGLIRAIEKFDWRKGFRFSSYAAPAIRNEIIRALKERSALIRKPPSLGERQRAVRKAEDQLEQRLGRTPTIDELAKATGYSFDNVVEALNVIEASVSLYSPTGRDDSELIDTLEGESGDQGQKNLEALAQSHEIDQKLQLLTPRQKAVMERLLGINGFEPMNGVQIGKDLGVSSERVRQLKKRAIEKMQASPEPTSSEPEPGTVVIPSREEWADFINELPFQEIELLELSYRGFSLRRIADELALGNVFEVEKAKRGLAARFGLSVPELMEAAPEILKLAGEIIE